MESTIETSIELTTEAQASNTNNSINGEKENEVDKEKPARGQKPVPEVKKKTRQDFYNVSKDSSHTKFYKKPAPTEDFRLVTRNEFLSISESMSGSSNTFNCVHGPEGKKYTEKGLLKKNLLKKLDPVPIDRKWNDECPPAYGWEMGGKLEFMVQSSTVGQQMDRFTAHLRDFARTSSNGYRIDTLNSLCTILDYLMESKSKAPVLKEGLLLLLQNLKKPILLKSNSDVVTYFDMLRHFIGFMGYLLIRTEDDNLFNLVSQAIIWHLTAPNSLRGQGTVLLQYTLAAAAPVLQQTTVRMIAVASAHRFPTFLEIALLLACDTVDNCIAMMKENIIENIFYRFNPYFPERQLPNYDINPHNCQDLNVKLGDSSVNISTTMSLLLVLTKTTKQYLEENPANRKLLPPPDCYSLRCFIWAFRYECRARGHRNERITLTVIATVLLKCFGNSLLLFSSKLMPDVISLSVLTELPHRSDWVGTVNFNTSQKDVQFKKTLINFVVELLKVFPYNKFLLESRHWLLGIMYLLDPGLCHLRSRWSPCLYAELRKAALQALVCTLPLANHALIRQYGLIRRILLWNMHVQWDSSQVTELTMLKYGCFLIVTDTESTSLILWYIEWYSESPYEISVLYWCVRVLHVAIYDKNDPARVGVMKDLFDTHGLIILIHLCHTLMEQKLPPVERSQAVIALSLRMLTSAVDSNKRVSCCVYPTIKWPYSINGLARKMLDVVLYSLEKHFIISDRWLISILNFIWEAIIWKQEYRVKFVSNDGIYKLLDLITMTRPSVQCIALALICDVASAGDGVGHLVSWRANLGASNAYPNLVLRGSTIATLLAAVFREGCRTSGVKMNEYGVIQDLDFPIMSLESRSELANIDLRYTKSHRTTLCTPAADIAGCCMSKAFALLHLLCDDLEYRVSLADEAYNLYKNIKLAMEDEVVLVLCSHYLTLKLNEVWHETKSQSFGNKDRDDVILDDFIEIAKGWSKEIKRQQEDVIVNERKREREEENSLYAFLGRIRLNVALDALRSVRCVARSTDHDRMRHVLLHDAVFAHQRRTVFAKKTNASVLRTYKPTLDDQNMTGQNVKVTSINLKHTSKAVDPPSSSPSTQTSE